jgi:hypothetical protein
VVFSSPTLDLLVEFSCIAVLLFRPVGIQERLL